MRAVCRKLTFWNFVPVFDDYVIADMLLPKRTAVRSSKYLNDLIEQGHRGVKSRTRPMLGFKNFKSALSRSLM
jgi:transposase-like protein